ncbi:polyphosphate kinase 2 [Rubellimicrobium sp. CFH 75288]|uniref:polyphosphate kinase 2 n=1 Tax=Rubellimicrobium sp. CFH 75288 TaxID=2697034 RepID=UPI001411E627|nr:polyphosphate kinase 2 [Rubellimicrobium sp. CFH 75288]NAZ36818.1 polyphosphate kinase 2 [Rubellimicrobium sp. CFH 75288]
MDDATPHEDLPFDGAISRYLREEAPDEIRQAVESGNGRAATVPRFPYPEKMPREAYAQEMARLQVELVRLQAWVKESGTRVVVVFEGRDAAGKGGSIKAFTENLNPRTARIVALPAPTEAEKGEWYFQRYVRELPTRGEIVLFDRSWYNRGVVEHVFGFCTPAERALWFRQVEPFERMLVEDGILLFKVWINVGRATQLERMLARERDPLKQWKLSWIDVEGLRRWGSYSAAITETLERTDHAAARWIVLRGDDKRRARLNLIRAVLGPIPYARKDPAAIGALDPLIAGGPELRRGDATGC